MEENVKQRLLVLELLARSDAKYLQMLKDCAALEEKYNRVLGEITTEQMDIICDFLTHCEAMSDRVLELACAHMCFPE